MRRIVLYCIALTVFIGWAAFMMSQIIDVASLGMFWKD